MTFYTEHEGMKEKIGRLNFIKMYKFCFVKDTVKNKTATDGEKIFTEDTSG